ncbi:MAG: aminotransferase class IV [Chitinophagaceae bacterium]
MTDYIVYNGSFHKNSTPLVSAGNRGLRYGDGLFDTLKFADGKIHLDNWHFERLFNGLRLLEFELPPYFTAVYLAGQVEALCKKNQHKTARVRINIFRGNGGLYNAENHFPNCIIESWQLPEVDFNLNENGLVTGIYKDAKKPMDRFSNLKSNNYLPYTMAALYAKKQQWNDAFLLNAADRICDATIANIFIIKNEVIYTSPLQEGCVAGIMRRLVLETLPAKGFNCQEKIITEEDLFTADEVFLTNSIKGIRWVGHCGAASYTGRFVKVIFEKLLKK